MSHPLRIRRNGNRPTSKPGWRRWIREGNPGSHHDGRRPLGHPSSPRPANSDGGRAFHVSPVARVGDGGPRDAKSPIDGGHTDRRSAPQGPRSRSGTFLALLGGSGRTPLACRTVRFPAPAVGALIDRARRSVPALEREAFLPRTPGLSGRSCSPYRRGVESGRSWPHIESARQEREHLVREFLDRVDHLSSKISTSAARYEAQLAEKDVLIEDGERKVEAYAGRPRTRRA